MQISIPSLRPDDQQSSTQSKDNDHFVAPDIGIGPKCEELSDANCLGLKNAIGKDTDNVLPEKANSQEPTEMESPCDPEGDVFGNDQVRKYGDLAMVMKCIFLHVHNKNSPEHLSLTDCYGFLLLVADSLHCRA